MTLDGLALSRSTVDRAAERRADPHLLDALLADAATAVLVVDGDLAPVAPGPGGLDLVLVDPATALAFVDKAWDGGTDGAAVPAGPRAARVERLYLGRGADGRDHLAIARTVPLRKGSGPAPAAPGGPDLPEHALPGTRWAGLREVGSILDDTGAGLFTASVAMAHWHAGHRFCSRCGAATVPVLSGWTRQCPGCGAEHYPRTDGAVIMAITDPADRILLGRQARWPAGRYSCLAGFVEPGESLEAAVRREAREEAGVVVGAVEYRGSQPWPFPASLMLGFRGRAESTDIRVDGEELAAARWWTREELSLDLATGELLLPPQVSIARRLVEDWFGGPVRDGGESWR